MFVGHAIVDTDVPELDEVERADGDNSFVARCPIAPETDQDGILVYRFELNDQFARSSRFKLEAAYDANAKGAEFVMPRI